MVEDTQRNTMEYCRANCSRSRRLLQVNSCSVASTTGETETLPGFDQRHTGNLRLYGHINWLVQMMREIQATEAKARLAELLRAVELGETVAITRHGKAVAHLVPASEQERTNRQLAVQRFRQRRAGWDSIAFSTEEILAARHEGHGL